MISDVTISDVYIHDSKVPATTFEEMKLFHVSHSENIKIDNS
jgi:hypothetical protein